MSEYQKGDVVKIIPESVVRTFDKDSNGWKTPEGLWITEEMLVYCGTEAEITRVRVFEDFVYYTLEGNYWNWSDSCFEPAVNFDGMEELL